MTLSVDVTLSAQRALEHAMDVTVHNIANLNTSGFERNLLVMKEKTTQATSNSISFVEDFAIVRDTTQGTYHHTGDAFHVYINGPAYFSVQTDEGVRYTKNGAFTLNEDSQMVTANGHLVLDNNNAPIQIPDGNPEVSIGSDGVISNADGIIAELGLFQFENEYDMKEVGDTLLETEQAPQAATDASLTQYGYAGSNVSGAVEMGELTYILRQFQHNQKFLEQQNKLESDEVNQLVTIPS